MASTSETPAQRTSGISVLGFAPREILPTLLSFELLFVLFLFAGRYKGDPRFAWVPVDLTALFFAASVIAGAFIFVRSRFYRPGLYTALAGLCFVAWVDASWLWSPGGEYATEKALYVSTLALWPLLATALIIAPVPKRVRRLFTSIVVFGIWMAIETILAFVQSSQRGFIDPLGGGYLGLGYVCSLAALIVVAALVFGPRLWWRYLIMSVLFGMLLFVTMTTGGRGPLLAVFLAMILLMLFGFHLSMHRIYYSRFQIVIAGLLAVIGLVSAYMILTGQETLTFRRLALLFTEDDFGRSAGKRVIQWEAALEVWFNFPLFGTGVGGFPVMARLPAESAIYPHNLFLEVLAELGLVGLALLLCLFWSALRGVTFERLRTEPLLACAVLLFAGGFFYTMVSGDLNENRYLFALIGLLKVTPAGSRRTRITTTTESRPVAAGGVPAAPALPAARGRSGVRSNNDAAATGGLSPGDIRP